MSETERRDFVSEVRRENERDFGAAARPAVEQMLSAGHSHPWTYVYELTQNAIDAGARRVAWQRVGESTVRFRHDGQQALDEEHVRALASLGRSTKGLATIGFMGVGFKSVFARFRRARVSGFGWRFRFDAATDRGDLGARIPRWFDTLLPKWDEESPRLNPGTSFTTVFQLSQPAVTDQPLTDDLERLAAPDDPIPLAVLALRGLEEVRIDDVTWHLSAKNSLIEVRSSPEGSVFRWQSFASAYRPGDDETRALLEARRQLRDQHDDQGMRPERRVVALLPLDTEGRPEPPSSGLAYATLPTQTRLPFGFHLQADWLVDLDRQNLRPLQGNAWQETIVRQVPELVRQILVWLKKQPEHSKGRGYRTLADPTKDDSSLSEALGRLQEDFATAIGDLKVVPAHGGERDHYCGLHEAARLPGRFRDDFGRQPLWRPDLLFGRKLVQEQILGKRGVDFLRWLGCAREVSAKEVRWPVTVPSWWSALEEELSDDARTEALFALWHGLDDQEWHNAPVVLTEAGVWRPAGSIRWLNERPPSENEDSGDAVAKALADHLPRPGERVPMSLRVRVEQSTHPGTAWFKKKRREVKLASVVERACNAAEAKDELPLVELVEWALGRGDQRQDLVPLVMTEDGSRKPTDALLADPIVDHGACRRPLFSTKSPLVEDYAIIENSSAVGQFLEQAGVPGQVKLDEHITSYSSGQGSLVERRIGVNAPRTSVKGGYRVFDWDFPFKADDVPAEALQQWLSGKPSALRGRGRRRATGSHYGSTLARGTKVCTWLRVMRSRSWLLCTDGKRRKPSDVLLSPDLDYESAPVADIDPELAEVLQQEGIKFGESIPKSPALRRLAVRGDEEMPDTELAALLREVQDDFRAGTVTRVQLKAALDTVKLKGAPLTSRVVHRCGAGEGLRSDLGGWVVPLSSANNDLVAIVEELVPSIPSTTTGSQALRFLEHVWETRPVQVERLRSREAAAYRYVLDDLGAGRLSTPDWDKCRRGARLYGRGQWRSVDSSSLVVDDVRSPFVRQLLSDDRIAVAAAHLGDTARQVRRVAESLGVGLLSDEVEIQPGSALDREPPWTQRLQRLVRTLALLEGRRQVSRLALHESLTLRVGDTENSIRAYVQDRGLLVSGNPSAFAVEAADQLVNHFQLRQRGNDVAWLTGALFSLEDSQSFRTHLKMLADGLGVEAGLASVEPDEAPAKAGSRSAAARQPADDRTGPTEAQGTASDRPKPHAGRSGKSPRLAVNQVAVFPATGRKHGTTRNNSGGTRAATRPKSDDKARRAVVQFEENRGRQAEPMRPGQPGFDVVSRDPVTGMERRIEIKGVEGTFDGDASVLLTARQVNDALEQERDAEYWLYVVDSTETESPRVYPIPWTRWHGNLRFGFFARSWREHAENDE